MELSPKPSFPKEAKDKVTLFHPTFSLSAKIFYTCYFLEAGTQKKIDGIKPSRGSPPLSYLLFAYDCFVFIKTNASACRTVKKILKEFCMLSRQEINFYKSELFES